MFGILFGRQRYFHLFYTRFISHHVRFSPRDFVFHLESPYQRLSAFYSVQTQDRLRMFSSINYSECWNCKHQIEIFSAFDVFCQNCKSIQNPKLQKLTHFELLGYRQPLFSIDTNELSTKMKELQKHLHPDKFSTKSEHERNFATDWSSLVNDAYRSLNSPVSRAQYLLELFANYNEDEMDGSQLKVDKSPEFLADMIELNEEVEDLTDRLSQSRDSKDIEALNTFKSNIDSKISSILDQMSQDFDSKNYDRAISGFHQLKFYESVLNRINNFEHSQL